MTEAEWLACADPLTMLKSLHRKKSRRKQRLFASACVRLVWDQVPPHWRRAVELNEGYADGAVGKDELRAAFKHAESTSSRWPDAAHAAWYACDTTNSSHFTTRCAASAAARLDENLPAQQAALLRDLFHPFRRAGRINSAWLAYGDQSALRLAQAIYDERAFDRLPILADVLEEAGCTDADLLDHLRGPGPHARGCWAVDLILGRE